MKDTLSPTKPAMGLAICAAYTRLSATSIFFCPRREKLAWVAGGNGGRGYELLSWCVVPLEQRRLLTPIPLSTTEHRKRLSAADFATAKILINPTSRAQTQRPEPPPFKTYPRCQTQYRIWRMCPGSSSEMAHSSSTGVQSPTEESSSRSHKQLEWAS